MTNEERWVDEHGDVIDEDHRGLVYDVQTMINRRRALGIFGGVALTSLLAACGVKTEDAAATSAASTSPTTPSSASTSPSPTAAAASGPLTEVPDETGGPYPGDGSNGVDVLDDSGIVRSDIRSTFGSATTTTADGVPLTIRLTVRDAATGDAKQGCAVYVWHCDRSGGYSLYAQGLENVNYLRGVQPADDTGTVEFTSIFPACYSGRWPHVHFEVYENVANATSFGPIVKTSQIALPKETCDVVYAESGYEQSVSNLQQTSLSSDMVFGDDGGIHQIASMSGSVAKGYTAALTI